ncbi:tetratricopeptide repeat protein [Candidatus Chlorohelix sp.]|uniref:tetratricopeptide repeat protein n=1 Tax=Candidatus Chlorohelix sp. TaxID=3139201 RepID=UPI0030548381
MDKTILVAKITAPKARGLVSRQRLIDEINDFDSYRLLLISAGSGYGKTALLADFAAQTSARLIWYSLDEGDRDPLRFFRYLVQSVKAFFPEFGIQFEALLGQIESGRSLEQENNLQRLAYQFAEELATQILVDNKLSVMVLDDYQYAESEPVGTFMRHLSLKLPERFRLIVSTRSVPDHLPLAYLYAKRLIKGIGAAELSFKHQEIAALLVEVYKIKDPKMVDKLAEYSEGWVTAVILAMVSSNTSLSHLNNRSGPYGQGYLDSSALFEYLGDVVLADQPPDIEDFLLRTSCLHLLSPELCNELTSLQDSEQILEKLDKRKLFVEAVAQVPSSDFGKPDTYYYKYHSLFKRFLQSRLANKKERWRECNLKAAELAIRSEYYVEGVQNYLAINEGRKAAEIIAGLATPLYESGLITRLTELIGLIPQEAVESIPELAFIYSRILFDKGQSEAALGLIEKAEKVYLEKGAVEDAAMCIAQRALTFTRMGQVEEGARLIEKASALADWGGLSPEKIYAQALISTSAGIVNTEHGQIEQAETFFKKGQDLYRQLELKYRVMMSDIYLATLYKSMGRLVRAGIYYDKALKYFAEVGNQNQEAYCRYGLAICQIMRGNYREATEQLNLTLELTEKLGNLYLKANVIFQQGNISNFTDKHVNAREQYESGLALSRQIGLRILELETIAMLALNSLLEGNRAEAREFLIQGHELNRDYGMKKCGAMLEVVNGLLDLENRYYKRALAPLEQAAKAFKEHKWLDWLCRCRLYQAIVYFSMSEFKRAVGLLEESIGLVPNIGFEPYQPFDLIRASSLFEYAARKKISNNLHEFLLRKGYRQSSILSENSGMDAVTFDGTVIAQFETEFTPPPAASPLEFQGTPKLTLLRPSQDSTPNRYSSRITGSNFQLEVRTLDGGRVWTAEAEIEYWRISKAKELFFFLLEHGKSTREEIFDRIWTDVDHSAAANNFHFTLSNLRRLIKPVDIKFSSQSYTLSGEIWCDALELEKTVKAALSKPQELELEQLAKALDLYKRDYLDQIYSDWASPRRQELLKIYLEGLSLLASTYEKQRLVSQAILSWRRYLLRDEYREEAYIGLINCHLAMGNKKEAQHYYEECRHIMKEIDIEPSSEIRALLPKLA